MRRHIAIIGLIIVSLTFVAAGGRADESDGSPQEWSATYTGITEFRQVVIVKRAEFEVAWKAIFKSRPVPEVDFEKNVVACVFLGQRPTGGYGIEFGLPFVRKDKLVIPFWEKAPTGVVTEALTQPCVMKVFARKEKLESVLEKVEPPKTQKSPLLRK